MNRIPALLSAFVLAGCVVEEPPVPEPPTPPILGDDDDTTAGDDDDSAQMLPCDPALSMTPSEASVLPGSGLVTLHPDGGTGDYLLELTTDASGAQLNPDYGTYLPGGTPEVTDVVTLTDAGCIGSATASIHVVNPLDVAPTDVEMPPGLGFDVLIAEGSGSTACSLLVDGTGATVTDPCRYDGGSADGTDVIRVEDTETGETVDVTVNLVTGSTLSAEPARIYVPVGSTWLLRTRGGSGHVAATPTSGTSVLYSEGVFSAVSNGFTHFDLQDIYTGQTTTVRVQGLAPLEGGFPRAGDNFTLGSSHSPGDIDGDGVADVVMGIAEADFGTYNTGAIFAYAGQTGGLAATPAWQAHGTDYEDRFGSGVWVGDVTGDGLPDLLGGAYLSDLGGTDAGEVRLYPGIGSGFFTDEPTKTWTGDNTYDYYGYSIVGCDLNGDGLNDLVVGAHSDEDRSVQDIQSGQGSFTIYLNTPNGLPELPSQKVYGVIPDGSGGWDYAPDIRIGSSLAAGDINGDGLCDVVVGGYEFEPPNENGNDGAVYVYLGTSTGGSNTGVYDEPVAAWAALEEGLRDTYFGRELAVGDVDGDGLDDILVGQYRDNNLNASSVRHGSARLFLGEAWTETPAAGWEMPSSSDWSVTADGGYDAIGWEVAIGDVTGDGVLDLIVSGYSQEIVGGVSNTGVVEVYAGVAGDVPDVVPTAAFPGVFNGDLYGTRLEFLDDLDGDGMGDLFVYASRAEEHGIHVGSPYFQSTAELTGPVLLDNPGNASGQRAGWDVAILGDVNGDGQEDALVGVPEYDNAGNQINAGLTQVFFGGPNGPSPTAWELKEFDRYSDSDRWAWKVSPAGDFNGDGLPDFAVLARYDDRPSSFSSTVYANPSDCPGNVSNTGAVAIFLGSGTGLPETSPAFLWYGPESGDTVRNLDGGFDYNGDGFDDLIVGGMDWDGDDGTSNVGGFEIIEGRPDVGGGTFVICNDGPWFEGEEANGRLGRDVAGLGDIDNDGCDETAIGAYDEDFGYSNQGLVRVLWGFGPGCGSNEAEVSILAPQDSNARAGYALAGGGDVDGDGVPDLAVGAYTRSVNGNSKGAAWLVPGSYLQGLPREPFDTDTPPTATNAMAPVNGGLFVLEGTVQDERFGQAVALVPGVGPGGAAGIAVAGPRGNLPGVDRVGGVRVHVYDPSTGGLDPTPWASMGGESFTSNGRVGEAIAAGTMNGAPALIVGGYRAGSWGPAQGAAWILDLTP